VPDWRDLAHRDRAALQAAGLRLHLDTRATASTSPATGCTPSGIGRRRWSSGTTGWWWATGALPQRPPIAGLDTLGPDAELGRSAVVNQRYLSRVPPQWPCPCFEACETRIA
jgi:hypothetical protein